MLCGILSVGYASVTSLPHLDCKVAASIYNSNMYDNTNNSKILFLENIVFGLNIDGDNATRPGPRSIISINIETSYIIF